MPTLNWIGKEAVVNHHQHVPFHLLKDVPDLACGQPGDGNLIVQGDNLVALKALLPYYAGQVKCIYIDPPYNTGNEGWVYNDNVNSPVIREWLGKVVGKEGETLDRHDRWLCMMYPRLALLRKFLREDGAIFISLDNTEVASLRLMMDAIFGSQNFVECITWNKRIPKNDAGIGNIHEYVMIYRKSSTWDYEFTMKKEGLERVDELLRQFRESKTPIPQAEAELRKLYRDEGYDRGVTLYNSLDEHYRPWGKINMSWPNANTFGPRYEVLHPRTGKPVKVPDRGWRWKEETFKHSLADGPRKELHDGSIIVGRIWFDKDEKTQTSSIKFLDEVNRILLRSILSTKSDGGIELEQIFEEKAKFAYPKPTSLVQVLIDSLQMTDGDIVFDSFAGSGTTAHATLKQNAEDGIQRKFILVEMEPKIARGVTTERVRRVAEGYKNSKGEQIEGLSGGFRYCELGEPLFDESGKVRKSVSFADLARHVYFSETGEPLPRERVTKSPFIGACRGVGIYLLYNGILTDKSTNGGNVLTRAVLAKLPPFDGQKVIYCAGCLLGRDRLQAERIIVRQTPYEIKVS
jgi:adenine-specific DNA-methyltransferase